MRSILLCSAAFTLLFATLAHPAAKIFTAFHPGQDFRESRPISGQSGQASSMGAPASEAGRDDIEGPQRRVTIPQFFGFAQQSILLAPEILQT